MVKYVHLHSAFTCLLQVYKFGTIYYHFAKSFVPYSCSFLMKRTRTDLEIKTRLRDISESWFNVQRITL
jgi:hypothetical protein